MSPPGSPGIRLALPRFECSGEFCRIFHSHCGLSLTAAVLGGGRRAGDAVADGAPLVSVLPELRRARWLPVDGERRMLGDVLGVNEAPSIASISTEDGGSVHKCISFGG